MNATVNIMSISQIKNIGTEALLKALGPTGMIRYLEQFDNGGSGDYTKEKYEQPEYSIEDILNMK